MRKIDFVLFGSTGDLSSRKIIPAIENLILKKYDINIFAVGRRDYSTKDYIEHILKQNKFSKKILSKIKYVKADITNPKSLNLLKKIIKNETIFFFATHYEFYEKIILQLKKLKLVRKNTKAIFEKPFGEDLKSAIKLNQILHKVFSENQIYRIDHYLGKETVQNIMILRFANSIFEPLWNNNYISNIQIIIDEEIGIEKRGQYYDKTGAIKDMIQNHVLQLISILLMDKPNKFNAQEIHKEKLKVLKNIKGIEKFIVGQYKGYLNEEHVNKNSKAETFTALKIDANTENFKGVPVFVRTGKKLGDKKALINIEFKKKDLLFDSVQGNRLVLNIQPNQDIIFSFNTKKPHTELGIKRAHLEFCHECRFKENSPEGYEKLIGDAINNDLTLFIKSEELVESWRIIDQLNLKNKKIDPFIYEPDKIPFKAKKFIKSFGFEWII